MDQQITRKATLLIMSLFFLQPMALGAWLAMIPYIKETLGPRKTFAVVLPLQALAVALPLLASSIMTLFFALAVFGALVAFMEVAMNTYAGRLEKAAELIIMSRCHGFWALGVMVGSLLATQLFWIGPMSAVMLVAAVSAAIGVWSGLSLPQLEGEAEAAAASRRRLRDMPKALLLISVFVLTVTMVEGAMSDWAAVYLAEKWDQGAEGAGIAVSIFAGFLAAGRFIGDYMKRRLGARGVARLTVGLAVAGLLCITATNAVPLIFVGFALTGLGVSIGFPLGISAAAALDDTYESQNIATMSMIAMTAFLLGPPLIGLIAEFSSLRVALLGLFPGLCLAFWLTRVFPER